MEDIWIQLTLFTIGAFIGYIVPKFFSWKDELRKERMNNYTDLLKNCYGRLLYVKFGILNRIKGVEEYHPGKEEFKVENEWRLILKQVYSEYYYELKHHQQSPTLISDLEEVLTNISVSNEPFDISVSSDDGSTYKMTQKGWFIDVEYIPKLKAFFDEITKTHTELSGKLKSLSELKKGFNKNINFYFPWVKID